MTTTEMIKKVDKAKVAQVTKERLEGFYRVLATCNSSVAVAKIVQVKSDAYGVPVPAGCLQTVADLYVDELYVTNCPPISGDAYDGLARFAKFLDAAARRIAEIDRLERVLDQYHEALAYALQHGNEVSAGNAARWIVSTATELHPWIR